MAGRSKGFRRWMLVLAGAFSLAPILVIVGLQMADAASPAPATPLGPILRLHDLQIGYEGALECAPLERAEEPPSELTKFIDGFKPQGCIAGYLRLFGVKSQEPDPPVVGSAVLEARSGAEAGAALAVLPLLVARINDGAPAQEVAPAETIGETTRLFHLGDLETAEGTNDNASALVWRSGNVLAGVLVAGASSAANDRIAAIYAQRQQAHIETRMPYTQAERVDTDALLDDPNLPVDVHWLGRRFHPGHSLPSSKLLSALSPEGDDGSGAALELYYRGGLFLGSWTRAAWRHHRRTKDGRLVHDWACTRTSTVPVQEGVATVYAGYRRDFASCPKRPPSVFFADVQLGRTVVSIGPPVCHGCGLSSGGRYNSPQGIRAAVRSLRPRTPAAPR